MNRAVGYFRVSTNKVEQQDSIKNQEEIFMNYIKDNDFELCGFYVDKGITGTGRKKRPSFNEMIADMQMGKFDILVVKELSRLARNVELAEWTKRIAIDKNIRILSIDGQIDTFDSKKNEDFSLYAWLYQKESQQISNRIKNVFQAKQRSGKFLGSIPPYGYKIVDRLLIKRDDYTEDVVKNIFQLFLKGWGQEKIARYLDKQGYPTPAQVAGKANAGKFWHGTTVKKILTNYHYTGHLVQHRESFNSLSSTKRQQLKEDDMIWVHNTHEAIIDESTFNLVKQKIESKIRGKKGSSKGNTTRYTENRHLFTNYLFCAECGTPYWFRGNCKGYLCGARLKRGKSICDNDIIREQHLIEIIKKDLKQFLQAENNIDIDSKLDMLEKKSAKRITTLENRINNLKGKNKQYLDKLLDGTISDKDYKDFIQINNQEVESLQSELNQLAKSQPKKTLDMSSIKRQIESITNLQVFDRELINMLINRIEISKNGELKVFYTFSSPSEYNYKKLKAI